MLKASAPEPVSPLSPFCNVKLILYVLLFLSNETDDDEPDDTFPISNDGVVPLLPFTP